MATVSICLYTELLKLNVTDVVAAVSNRVKNTLEIVSETNLLLCRVSTQI